MTIIQVALFLFAGLVAAQDYAEIAYTGGGRGAIDASYFANQVLRTRDGDFTYLYHDAGAWLEPEDFDQYKAVMIFSLGTASAERPWSMEDVARVTDWVQRGGVLILTGNAPYRLAGNDRNLGILESLLGAGRYEQGGPVEVLEPNHPLLAPLAGREDLLASGSAGLARMVSAKTLIRSGDTAQLAVNILGEGSVIYLGQEFTRLPMASRELYAELIYEALLLADIERMALEDAVVSDNDVWALVPLGPQVVATPPGPPPVRQVAGGTLITFEPEGDPVLLIRDNQAHAVIVLADNPSRVARNATDLLRESLEKMTGVILPVHNESQLHWEADARGNLRASLNGNLVHAVIVGETRLSKPLLENLPPEGYVIKTLPNNLLIVAGSELSPDGNTTNGTYFGMIGLLERHLGFRWLWPGPLGEVIPEGDEVVVPAIHETNAPALTLRRMRSSGYAFNARNRSGISRMGVSEQHYREQTALADQWSALQRLGGNARLAFGHSYTGWWERYGRKHPEWFALQPDGTRVQHPPRERLCVANLELAAEIASDRIQQLTAEPSTKAVSISPNDGSSRNSICMCPLCRSYDSPDGREVNIHIAYNGYRRYEKYPSLSDRYLNFYNRIAEQVAEAHPDRWLGAYAYSAYRSAPLYTRAHPNLLIGFVGLNYFDDYRRQRDLEDWNGWTQSANQVFLRPNALLGGHGFPSVYVTRLADDIRHCYETGMVAADFSSVSGHWAGLGLNYYVLPKLLWDPGADVKAMVRDYCERGFGPASDEILNYFSMLETITDTIARASIPQTDDEMEDEDMEILDERGSFLEMVPRVYSQTALASLHGQLDRALAKAREAGNATVIDRISFLRRGLVYADIQSRLYGLRMESRPDNQAINSALEERYQFLRDTFNDDFFAVGVSHLVWSEGWIVRNPHGWRYPSR